MRANLNKHKRLTAFLCACILSVSLYATAQGVQGEMRRFYNMDQSTDSSGNLIPNFLRGFKIAGVMFDGTSLGYLFGVTPGTVTASKGVVVDSNKDIASFRNLSGTNIKAGISGTAGTVTVFPAVASRGSTVFSANNNVGNTLNTISTAGMAGVRNYLIPDVSNNNTGTESASVVLSKQSYTLQAAGSAYAPSASTEAVMNGGTATIDAGKLNATASNTGTTTIEFMAAFKVGAINATDTFTARVRVGGVSGTIVASHISGATTAANDVVILRGTVYCSSFSTPNMTMVGAGTGHGLLAGVASVSTATIATAFTKDSTAAIDLVATGQFSTNSATNSATLQLFTMRVIGGV